MKTLSVIEKYPLLKKVWKVLASFPFVLILFGLIGLTASIVISEEKFHLIKHPDQALVCDLNPVYSCGKIIDSDQSKLLGFSNELTGIIMFSILLATGVVLVAGAKLKNWYWRLFLVGMIGFMLTVFWLFYQSVYVIGNLCLFCTIVWFSGWAITARGFAWVYDQKLLQFTGTLGRIIAYKRRNILGIWLLVMMIGIGLVLNHFWYYYGQYF